MPGRNPELPEGTDHIINGAAELGGGGSGETGFVASSTSGSDTGGFSTGGGTSGGFGGGGGISQSGGDLATGASSAGLAGGGLAGGGFGGTDGGALSTGGSGDTGGLKAQAANGVQTLKSQATDKVRSYALDGKNRATGALDDLANVVQDAASQIDEKLGAQYGQYARQAADAVSGFADTIRQKDVDDLFDDAREVIRKSPAVAIGVAAAVGFALVRLVKAGMPEQPTDVEFTSAGGQDVQFVSDEVGASAGAGAAAGA